MLETVYSFFVHQFQEHPIHLIVEALFVAFIIFLLPQRSYRISKKNPEKLTPQEQAELIELWEPKPIIPLTDEQSGDPIKLNVVTASSGDHMVVNGQSVVNFSSYNFLGFTNDEDVKEACVTALHKYGVGACGPRGFYGTIDVHLQQEDTIAKFLKTPEAILYSYDFATITSVIPAFLKREDLIVCDIGATHAVKMGCVLSRSLVKYFKHNDMEDLQRVLSEIATADEKTKNKKPLNRRYIVIEGLYQNFGDIANLPEILKLAKQFKYRIIMDDSMGVGVLGRTGRGTTEHFGIPSTEIDILTGSLSNAFASVGGFCAGSHTVVDHQRLSGSGYVFSASLPPYLSAAGIAAINKLDAKPDLVLQLQKNIETFHDALAGVEECGLQVSGASQSPVMHLRLTKSRGSRRDDERALQSIVDKALQHGIALTTAKYTALESHPPPPSIRVCVSARHTPNDLSEAANVIKQAARDLLA